jgi:hypothetical protein
MSRPNPGKLAAFLVVFIALAALPIWLKGGLYITNFDGDALHLADIVLRMAAGERPHLDFATPLGILGFWPFLPGLRAGLDLGHAFALGQTLFALCAAGLVWWAAVSRLSTRLAYGFAGAAVILLTSLSHGASGSMIAVSMHYNRWAWVLAFVAVVIAVLKPVGRVRPWIDGAVLALAMAGMAFLKVTYVAAFGPALLLILLVRRERALLVASLGSGAVVAVVATALLGPAMMLAYLGDIRAAAAGPIRNKPGLELHDIVISPAYLVVTLTALAGAAILRRGGAATEGLSILILIPAFLYVTWQNYGNDPIWLILLSVLLFAMRPARRAGKPPEKDPSVGVGLAAFAALVLSVPMLQNHAAGGLRLLALDTSRYRLMVPDRAGLGDVYAQALGADLVRARRDLTDPGEPYAALAETVPDQTPLDFAGATVPNCQILTGIEASLETLAKELGSDGDPVFFADMISSHWLYANGEPLPGGAPWNYGTLSGLDAAGRVLVPLCPINLRARNAILTRLAEEGPALTLARETPLYRLYDIDG